VADLSKREHRRIRKYFIGGAADGEMSSWAITILNPEVMQQGLELCRGYGRIWG